VGIFSIAGNDIQGNNWCDVIRCSYNFNFRLHDRVLLRHCEFGADINTAGLFSHPNPSSSMRSWSDIDLIVQPFEPTFCILSVDWRFPRMNDLPALPHGLLSKLALLTEG
jgi:hypothetical protein